MPQSCSLDGGSPSFTENQKEILVRVAQALKTRRKELDMAWETYVQNSLDEVTLLRKRHLREFIHHISAGDFKGWEEKLCRTAEHLRREKISLSFGHSLHFCNTASCLDLLMKEFPQRQQWPGILLALECFQNRNIMLVIQGYGGDAGEGTGEVRSDCLTPREREVLQLVVKGLISKEIAGRLGISVKTVEVHRANMMKKLGINNVAQLVSWAYRQGERGSGAIPPPEGGAVPGMEGA